jgi:phosphohistidine phosphatase SixA
MHDAFGDVEVRDEPRLYNAPSDVLRRFVESCEDEAGCLLLLAHNPGVHVLATEYLSEAPPRRPFWTVWPAVSRPAPPPCSPSMSRGAAPSKAS